MGIRFYCDACDRKLNVKSFLAGKRGICPHCGARVMIPTESEIPSSKDDPANDQDDQRSDPLDDGVFTNQPAAAKAVATATPVEAVIPTARAVAIIPASITPPTSPRILDPIAEAPNAVWYVRPPSGGQFGPADGDVMARWLTEGRVSADSLVWREGWDDWRTAGPEFPQLSGGKTPPPATPTAGNAATTVDVGPKASSKNGSAATTLRHRTKRQTSSGMGVAVIVVLGLLVVVLGIVFVVLVLNNDNDKDADKKTGMVHVVETGEPAVDADGRVSSNSIAPLRITST